MKQAAQDIRHGTSAVRDLPEFKAFLDAVAVRSLRDGEPVWLLRGAL